MNASPEFIAGQMSGLEKRLDALGDSVLDAIKTHAADDKRNFDAVFAQGDGNKEHISGFKLMVAEVKGMIKGFGSFAGIAQIIVLGVATWIVNEMWTFHDLTTKHTAEIAGLSQTVAPAIVQQAKDQSEENGRGIAALQHQQDEFKKQFTAALTELRASNINVKKVVEVVNKSPKIIVVPATPNGPGVIQRFVPKGRP